MEFLRVRHLRFILLLHELGSLAATAERLSVTPSAASMMLKEIEHLVEAKLFVKVSRGMAPTEYGQMILPRCRTVLGEVSAMRSSMQAPTAPVLRIGVIPHTTATVLPEMVKALTLGTPAWRLQLHEANVDRLVQMLLDGELDLVVGRIPRPLPEADTLSDLAQRPLYQSAVSVVCGRDNPLLRAKTLTLADIQQFNWALPASNSMTRVAFAEAFLLAGLSPPTPAVETPSVFYSLAIVASTDLLTCCPEPVARMHSATTSILPIELGIEPSPVALLWRRSSVEASRAVELLGGLSPTRTSDRPPRSETSGKRLKQSA